MTENLLVSLNDIEEKEASWLVPQRMPKGQIIILAGDGGSGKTSCWCSLAAAISTGAQVFFDETPKEFFESEPQKVLFFSSEDSLEYTLKARLRKAGANFNNIFSVDLKNERFSEIKFNSKLLKELIEQVKPALIVFDPLQAFIPVDMQMGQRNAMRACLSPLIGKALPEQLEKIKSVYEKRYKKVRQIALEQVESETKSIKQRNQGKFKPDFVDLELLKELNAISAAGIPMTESEVEAYCKRAIASRSSFCVRAVQNILIIRGI